MFDVVFERYCFIIESRSFQPFNSTETNENSNREMVHLMIFTAYETSIAQYIFSLLLFVPQIGESIDDNTKNQVQHDND